MKRAPKHVPTKDAENTATNPAILVKNVQLLKTIELGVIQKVKNFYASVSTFPCVCSISKLLSKAKPSYV